MPIATIMLKTLTRAFVCAWFLLLILGWQALTIPALHAQNTNLNNFVSISEISPELLLLQKIKEQDIPSVSKLLMEGANPNAVEVDGSSALLWAVYLHEAAIVDLLLAAGAETDTFNRYGVSPLLQACRNGDSEIVFALLNAGADPLFQSPQFEPPVMAAAETGLTEVVELLVNAGADVNAFEPFQHQTALMWAAENGHNETIRSLLNAGADVNAVTETYEALSRERLESGRQWVGFSNGGMTALFYAAREGQIEASRLLASAGVNLDHVNPDGVTALMTAVVNDRLDLASLLLDYGANPNDGSMYELVQLHNQDEGMTISGDSTRPHIFQQNTITPAELMAEMLAAGGDPNLVSGHTLHVDSMDRATTIFDSTYKAALSAKDVSMLSVMLASGRADANVVAENDAPPLNRLFASGGGGGFGRGGNGVKHFPGIRDLRQSALLLLEYGADVTLASIETGETPLHLAAQQNQLDLISEFHAHGANLGATDNAGFTPLDHAMGRRGATPGGRSGGFAPPQPQPEAIALLSELMGLPVPAAAMGQSDENE